VAEEKVAQCREEAKAVRETEDNRVYALSEVQSQLRKISRDSRQAVHSSDQVMGAQRENAVSHSGFEAQLEELEARVRVKASESVVESMRNDLELSTKVLQDAIKAVAQRISDQEDRLKGFESAPVRRTLVQDTTAAVIQSLAQQGEHVEVVNASNEDATHCLLCHNDRSMSPTRTLIGTDNQVYGYIAASGDLSTEGMIGETQLLSSLRASPNALQNFVRPRPTPASIPSIPRPQSAPHARMHPEVVSTSWERQAGTTAAAVSSMQRGGRRLSGRDVKSKKIGDLVAVESANSAVGGRNSTLPASAQQRPARPTSAGTVRPSSAGAVRSASAGTLTMTLNSATLAAAAAESRGESEKIPENRVV